MSEADVYTLSCGTELIESSGGDNIILAGQTQSTVNNALFYTRSQRNIITFKDIHHNGYHIETGVKGILNTSISQLLFRVRNICWINYLSFLPACTI